jgi:TRAP-type C4-dicarboxylate transport system permease small subunit
MSRLTGWLENAGAVLLFAMMAVTTLDVAGRYLVNRPLPGSTEIVQVLLALSVACVLPAVSLRGEHISIGLFDGASPTPAERVRRSFAASLGAVAIAACAVLLWRHAGDAATNRDVIGYLRLPVAPMVYAMAGLFAVTAVAFGAAAWRAVRSRPSPIDPGAGTDGTRAS